MATKYSDIITIREGKPAYNIANEEGEQWKDFIANKQFNEILATVIKSVRNTDVDAHRSFWISGTYGTGKSHAGAVIKHLLCDKVEDIKDYVDNEYRDDEYASLRQNIYALREKKRLFPVMMYGAEGISHKEDLSLKLQQAISDALNAAGIYLTVQTDFDNFVDHINEQPEIWQLLIDKSPQLKSIAPDLAKLKQKLQNKDQATFAKVMQAQRETGINIRLAYNKLPDWFFEVQAQLANNKEKYGYDGLLVIWDEFTNLITSEIGISILVALQEVDERVMNKDNNSYFFYISHPSALNNLGNQERKKTEGRYHFMPYQMETVSAFQIMSRKFRIADGATSAEQEELARHFYSKDECYDLQYMFAPDSTQKEKTKNDLYNLFPLHPSTANLATYYAREAGSSSRSVFEFIGSNDAIRTFLDDENHFLNRDTITADYLWDFVLKVFNDDVLKYGVVTERYNARLLEVDSKGYPYLAVFKGILLLNALNNIAANTTVTPSGKNIANLFAGTSIAPMLQDILQYFDEHSIIQRLPGDDDGLYSIQFSALPTKEIEDEKQGLMLTEFKLTEKLLTFDEAQSRKLVDSWLAKVKRPYKYKFYSLQSSESALLHSIETAYNYECNSYELFLALLFAKDMAEMNTLKEIAQKASADERFQNVTFVVFQQPFEKKNYDRFIEFMANSKIAGKYNQKEQQKAHLENAFSLIKDWLNAIRRNPFAYYLRGVQKFNMTMKMTSVINDNVATEIFSKGPESLMLLQSHPVPDTFWKKQSSQTIVENFLLYNTKPEVLAKCNGPMMPIRLWLQDIVDDNLEWNSSVDTNHPLYLVNEFIENKFKHTTKSEAFNMGERLIDLTKPPFGLYQSYASFALVAFAMRKWVKQIFDLQGKPRDAQLLKDDIVEMFKAWENNKESNKLNFRFETKESRNLCNKLVKEFSLNKLKGYNDISSLTDARNAFKYGYLAEKGYPLWVLKYIDENIKDGLKDLFDNILRIISTDNTRDPKLLDDTLTGFDTYHFELQELIREDDAFVKGFRNYMLQVPNLNFKVEEFDEAHDYLIHHLQNAQGLWSEDEVQKELFNWRTTKAKEENVQLLLKLISGLNSIEECTSYLSHGDYRVEDAADERIRILKVTQSSSDNPDQSTTPQRRPRIVPKSKRTIAVEKVNTITDVNKARTLLRKICESDFVPEYIIELINNYDA